MIYCSVCGIIHFFRPITHFFVQNLTGFESRGSPSLFIIHLVHIVHRSSITPALSGTFPDMIYYINK